MTGEWDERWGQWIVAAVLLVALCVAGYLYLRDPPQAVITSAEAGTCELRVATSEAGPFGSAVEVARGGALWLSAACEEGSLTEVVFSAAGSIGVTQLEQLQWDPGSGTYRMGFYAGGQGSHVQRIYLFVDGILAGRPVTVTVTT